MAPQKTRSKGDGLTPVDAAARRNRERLEKTYRQQALRMFPAVCARCGREFTGKRLRELTVHHKDHNHDNNPPDGSNWELLCVYCHDYEHTKYLDEELYLEKRPAERGEPPATYRPFADLADILARKK